MKKSSKTHRKVPYFNSGTAYNCTKTSSYATETLYVKHYTPKYSTVQYPTIYIQTLIQHFNPKKPEKHHIPPMALHPIA